MDRADIESHEGYNVVLAKIYETHDGLRDVVRTLEAMASELLAHVGQKPSEQWTRKAAQYHDIFVEVIHAHHKREDEEIFPYLDAWFEFDCSALDEEHAELNRLMPVLREALTQVVEADALTRESVDAFADATKKVGVLINTHFDREEATVCPALLRLTEEDFSRMFLDAPPAPTR